MSFQYRKTVASDLINDAKETWAGTPAPWPHSRSSSIWQEPQRHQRWELMEPMLRHQPSCKHTMGLPKPSQHQYRETFQLACVYTNMVCLYMWSHSFHDIHFKDRNTYIKATYRDCMMRKLPWFFTDALWVKFNSRHRWWKGFHWPFGSWSSCRYTQGTIRLLCSMNLQAWLVRLKGLQFP